ncbi:serine/threonine-protein kinase [Sorangium cellulosum]|uniref:Protein kinase n=1 Tax=Sorangium cellulosum TaxID=56 RepID=A0A150TQ63_SORCE|nr:serine/threonine-protein kinase [Sorangium cellulosum]KYG06810.1 protein kinase [Sorangium cellulosum]
MNAPVVAGDVIAEKYRVDRVLGRGGKGVVVGASHLVQPERVAIKLLVGDSSPALVERFLREARAAVRLRGEHVARVLDVGQLDSGVPYLVMEHLDGRDLAELLRDRGQLELSEAIDYVLQACVAMAEAHAAGIVHGNLDPANLFLTTTPGGATLLKVLDVGISAEPSSAGDGGAAAQEGLGVSLYLAPEQLQPSRPVDARADIWSLGAILYRLLTGQPPFEASSPADLGLRVASAEPALPSALRPDIPPAVERVLLGCLAKEPARRPANVAELAIALAPHAPVGSQDYAQRAARILGATLPPRPRASLPTIGLGLNAKPRPAPRLLQGAEPGAPALSRTFPQETPHLGRPATRLAILAALASLLAILGVAAAQLK